jgi:hypothetical protein
MSESVVKASLDILFIGIFAKAAEKKSTCLPITTIRAIYYFRYSLRNFTDEIQPTATNKSGQSLDSSLSHLWKILIRLRENQNRCHHFRQQSLLQLLNVIPNTHPLIIDELIRIIKPSQILRSHSIPELQC